MKPRIKILEEKKLIGKRVRMSFMEDKTVALWKSFAPRKKEIQNAVGSDLYSVEIYDNTDFFVDFNPGREFEKWAAVEVRDFNHLPDEMEQLIIP